MRVESSRDVYASAKLKVVFLASRIGRKTLAEVQKKYFQIPLPLERLRITDIYAHSITHLTERIFSLPSDYL